MTINTPPIDPKSLAEGRTIAVLSGPGTHVVRALYTAAFRTISSRNDPYDAGFCECWPDQYPYMSAVAWWNGKDWEGNPSEIAKCKMPGWKQIVEPLRVGVRGKELWPDPAVVCRDMEYATVFVGVENAPAESVVLEPSVKNCTVYVAGSANSVRIHGSRGMVVDRGEGNHFVWLNAVCPGQAYVSDGGRFATHEGHASCLSHLYDAGAIYCVRRPAEKDYAVYNASPGFLFLTQLPRAYPVPEGKFTAGCYNDDYGSHSDFGSVVTQGFTYPFFNGGGSWNDYSGVVDLDGRQGKVGDYSTFPNSKERSIGRPLQPYSNKLPGGAV